MAWPEIKNEKNSDKQMQNEATTPPMHVYMREHASENKFKLKIITHNALRFKAKLMYTHSFMAFCSILELFGLCTPSVCCEPSAPKNANIICIHRKFVLVNFYRSTMRCGK